MHSVLIGVAVYLFLLIVLRLAGRRTLSEMTTFDFVLILIISEATQSAMTGGDNSVTHSMILILTLVGLDIAFAYLKERSKTLEKWLDGVPMVIVRHGQPLDQLMKKSRINIDDILSAARDKGGLPNLESIEYAVLESNGHISIIPKIKHPAGSQ